MKTHTKISWLLSIRNRVLIFSVLVTLVPSSGMGWFYYSMSYRALAEKTRQRLMDSAGKVERDLALWLKDRNRDLHVFASSFVIVDNLTKIETVGGKADAKDKEAQTASSLKRITTYLNLVKNQFPDYRRLAVFDKDGRQVAASDGPDDETLALPADWQERKATATGIIGKAFYKPDDPSPLLLIGIPVGDNSKDDQLGMLVVEIRLRGVQPYLQIVSSEGPSGPWSVDLVQKDGRPLLASVYPEGQIETILTPAQKLRLFSNPLRLMTFDNGKWAVGLAVAFRDLPWGLVISESYDNVFADVIHSRDQIILTAVLFSLVIGLMASLVAGQIILPLETLTRGVQRVADGDLDVSLEIKRNDELGVVSAMFNEMAVRLKENQYELEKLAVTDPLTKLANRKQIMSALKTHIEYYRRYAADFSVLMIDIDHFKEVNDTHGHLMGDAVLVQIAEIFNRILRAMDIAGRYGGEEFLVILGQTGLQSAMSTAERIRQAVEQYPFVYQETELHVTISVGVAGIVGGDDTENTLISRADKALYRAKADGRNRVVPGGGEAPSADA